MCILWIWSYRLSKKELFLKLAVPKKAAKIFENYLGENLILLPLQVAGLKLYYKSSIFIFLNFRSTFFQEHLLVAVSAYIRLNVRPKKISLSCEKLNFQSLCWLDILPMQTVQEIFFFIFKLIFHSYLFASALVFL